MKLWLLFDVRFENDWGHGLGDVVGACLDKEDAQETARTMTLAYYRAHPDEFERLHKWGLGDLAGNDALLMGDDFLMDLIDREGNQRVEVRELDLPGTLDVSALSKSQRADALRGLASLLRPFKPDAAKALLRARRGPISKREGSLTVWLILEKGWEYDDSFYNFAGHQRVATICVHASQVPSRVRQATAAFVRDHLWSLDRFEIQNIPWDEREARVAAFEQNGISDDEAVAFAQELGLEPFTVQQAEITPAFLHAAGLSEGKRAQVLRSLADEVRDISPAAADELES